MLCHHLPRLALALCFLLGGALQAAENWPVKRGPSREPRPYTFDPKVTKSIPKDFLDDSVAVIIHAGTSAIVTDVAQSRKPAAAAA